VAQDPYDSIVQLDFDREFAYNRCESVRSNEKEDIYGGKKGKETSKIEKTEERRKYHSQKSILVSSTARTREAAAGRL